MHVIMQGIQLLLTRVAYVCGTRCQALQQQGSAATVSTGASDQA